jgi:hypothetical protein
VGEGHRPIVAAHALWPRADQRQRPGVLTDLLALVAVPLGASATIS